MANIGVATRRKTRENKEDASKEKETTTMLELRDLNEKDTFTVINFYSFLVLST